MKKLISALEAFGKNPESIGDGLFTFFAEITHMDWDDVIAAGAAISTLANEAYNASGKDIEDPTYKRIKGCMKPVNSRVATLIAKADDGDRAGLIAAANGCVDGMQIVNLKRTYDLKG